MSTQLFTRPLAGATLAAAALALPLLAPHSAAAGPRGPQHSRPSHGVFLTVSGSEHTWVRGVTLDCEPAPHGHHPHAVEACAALDRAGGDLDALSGDHGPCTKEYDPVTVSAQGTHRGRPVSWQKTFPNACTLHAATGPVFDF
ncbi:MULTISPECIES: SSI family serine proteinase inhibitor [unclassified Streptomyces]|uniref:SSI family serine proteinase inhibitor n=1 Tax=unclassified Streptomyces TaxID=2593676 RepID=UPI002DD86252|nr:MULTISPECIES: SSI family serine proteinase inhibitor [unclassified Streptomyces]WSA95635.1 subtilase-type protease inhibitor [Streptomyces sp. NBC_01795]WSB80054.1 subtilase-type protease inhibitor [Streptomyces sp. NBC_01775]WSS11738.1 subtilase-type protease inhibitor [Streptomyces sp. NBC_01186]WSS40451.1 subtilase-type protease inhibitor [Streptomyces sp. NBC_01187]